MRLRPSARHPQGRESLLTLVEIKSKVADMVTYKTTSTSLLGSWSKHTLGHHVTEKVLKATFRVVIEDARLVDDEEVIAECDV